MSFVNGYFLCIFIVFVFFVFVGEGILFEKLIEMIWVKLFLFLFKYEFFFVERFKLKLKVEVKDGIIKIIGFDGFVCLILFNLLFIE